MGEPVLKYIHTGDRAITVGELKGLIAGLEDNMPLHILGDNSENDSDTREIIDIGICDGKLIVCDF